MIDLTIILVSYNTRNLTLKCLHSIYEKIPSSIQYEIIIVDNNSNDGSVEAIKNLYPHVYIVQNDINLGFGAANNIGVHYARQSKYLLFLNTDTVVISDIFSPIISYMNSNNDISAVTPFIIYPDYKPQVTYGNFPSILSFVFSFFKIKYLFKKIWNNKLSYYIAIKPDKIKEVDHIVGVSMFVRRTSFVESGGFDTDYFLYFEETDLCNRIRKNGGKIFVYPYVEIIHLLNKSMPSNLFKLTHMERSRMLYFKKNCLNDYSWRITAFISLIKHTIWGIKNLKIFHSLLNYADSYKYVSRI